MGESLPALTSAPLLTNNSAMSPHPGATEKCKADWPLFSSALSLGPAALRSRFYHFLVTPLRCLMQWRPNVNALGIDVGPMFQHQFPRILLGRLVQRRIATAVSGIDSAAL